jgi:aminoglycoside phosphotransferase (APT) family kinase protein
VDVNDEVGDELVLALLHERRPDLAGLALRRVGRGWDNEIWRLGDDLGVRLARTDRAPELLRKEHRWLPEFAPHLPLPVPTPLYLAEESALFPGPWAVVSWVHGDPADEAEVTEASSARILAGFLRALHGQKLPDADGYEVSPRAMRNARCEFGEELISVIGEDRIRGLEEIWRDALSAGDWDGPPVWAHNDLHPANVVVTGGALSGVIDFGDLAPGDPATDLSAAWTLCPSGTSALFLQLYGDVDADTVRRARGWAVRVGVFVVEMGLAGRRGLPGGKPSWLPAGRRILDRVLEAC